jgi:uncharacterized protein (DUF1697 family)
MDQPETPVKPDTLPLRRYIAFLRAINVGGHTVKMDRLRTLFEVLEFANVSTFIASGNVVFESQRDDTGAIEREVEEHLQQALGFPVAAFIRSAAEVRAVADYQPFTGDQYSNEHALMIAFVRSPPGDQAWQKLQGYRTDRDDFHVHKREVYWLCRGRISESAFSGALLEKTLGTAATMRNSTTVRTLAAKYAAHVRGTPHYGEA